MRALLDISHFLRFAVKKCGAELVYLPLEGEELEELIGLARNTWKIEALVDAVDHLNVFIPIPTAIRTVGIQS